MSPINFYASNKYFMRPIDFYASNQIKRIYLACESKKLLTKVRDNKLQSIIG